MNSWVNALFVLLFLLINNCPVLAQKIIKRIDNYVLLDQLIEHEDNNLNVIRLSNQEKLQIGRIVTVRSNDKYTAAKIVYEAPGYTIGLNDFIEIPQKDTSSSALKKVNDDQIGYYFDRDSDGFIPYCGFVYNNHK